jgi:hypothetical protein
MSNCSCLSLSTLRTARLSYKYPAMSTRVLRKITLLELIWRLTYLEPAVGSGPKGIV